MRGEGPHGEPDCFSYPECGPTFDLGADKNACWGDSTYHRRLRASGRKKQQTELALLLYSVSIRCKHLFILRLTPHAADPQNMKDTKGINMKQLSKSEMDIFEHMPF